VTLVFLETERLILHRFTEDDFDDFYAFAADREMCRMMGRADLADPIAARKSFAWLKDNEPRGCCLVLKKTGRVIGNLTVAQPSLAVADQPALHSLRGCGLSFSISRSYQRYGLMLEALRAVIARLFSEEDFDYIICGHFGFDSASRALQQKLGFIHLFTESHTINGEQTERIENVLLR